MRYGQIRKYDVANAKGVSVTVFVTGCTHNCHNCFNKEYQDFNAGKLWTNNETKRLIEYLQDHNISALSILGGEPFQNEDGLRDLIEEVKTNVEKPIWIWSGYTFEQIIQDKSKLRLLEICDVLVDGKFIEKLKDLRLAHRGSSNQRVINVKESLRQKKVVLLDI